MVQGSLYGTANCGLAPYPGADLLCHSNRQVDCLLHAGASVQQSTYEAVLLFRFEAQPNPYAEALPRMVASAIPALCPAPVTRPSLCLCPEMD